MVENNVEVVFLENLVADLLDNTKIKMEFINEVLIQNQIKDKDAKIELEKYFSYMSNTQIVENEDTFLLDPMPNLYFTRDSLTVIGNNVVLNSMKFNTRKRESVFGKFLLKYHPDFKNNNIKLNYDYKKDISIEGGDLTYGQLLSILLNKFHNKFNF